MKANRVKLIQVYPDRVEIGESEDDYSMVDMARIACRKPDGSFTESHFEVMSFTGRACDRFDILTDGQCVEPAVESFDA